MAVDTAAKRFSMMNLVSNAFVMPLFIPDGTVDLEDRQHMLNMYSGIAFAVPVPIIADFFFTMLDQGESY